MRIEVYCSIGERSLRRDGGIYGCGKADGCCHTSHPRGWEASTREGALAVQQWTERCKKKTQYSAAQRGRQQVLDSAPPVTCFGWESDSEAACVLLTALAPSCLQTPKLSNPPHCSLISRAFTGDVSPMAGVPCRTMWRTSGSALGSVGGFASISKAGG